MNLDNAIFWSSIILEIIFQSLVNYNSALSKKYRMKGRLDKKVLWAVGNVTYKRKTRDNALTIVIKCASDLSKLNNYTCTCRCKNCQKYYATKIFGGIFHKKEACANVSNWVFVFLFCPQNEPDKKGVFVARVEASRRESWFFSSLALETTVSHSPGVLCMLVILPQQRQGPC